MFNSTELFCVIDDFFLKFEATYWKFLKQSRHSVRIRPAQLSLSEINFIAIWYKPGGFGAYRDGFEIINRAASKNKELVVVEGWSHYDLYDKPEPVKIALDKLIPFYQQNL